MINNDGLLLNMDEYQAVLDYKGNYYNTINVLLSDNITMREQSEDLRKLLPKTENDFRSIIGTIINLYSAIKKNYILNDNKLNDKKLFRGGRIEKSDNSFVSTSDDIKVALEFADYFDKTGGDGNLLIIDSNNVPYIDVNKIIPVNDVALSKESEILFLPCEINYLEKMNFENSSELTEITEEQMSELRKFNSLNCAKVEMKEKDYSKNESSLSESDLYNMFLEYKKNLNIIRVVDESSEKYNKAYQQIIQFKDFFNIYVCQKFHNIDKNIEELANTKNDNISISTKFEIKEVHIGNTGKMYHIYDKQNDGEYYFKPAISKNGTNRSYRAYIQEAAYCIQKIINPENAVKCNVTELDGMFGAVQEKIAIDNQSTERFIRYFNDGIGELPTGIIDQVLDEYLVDFCLCNYDSNAKNFIIDENGKLRGIDKEQSFRYISEDNNQDMLFSVNYNEQYGENPSIYSVLFSKMNNGEIPYKNLTEKGEISYRHLEELRYRASRLSQYPDEQYRKIFEKYAYSKAKTSEEAKILLDSILDRKNNILSNIEQLYYNIEKNKKTILKQDIISIAKEDGVTFEIEDVLEDMQNLERGQEIDQKNSQTLE